MIHKQLKVLIIEDSWLESELLHDLLREKIEQRGASAAIQVAATEKDAYLLLSNNHYDIGIFDIDLDKRGAGLNLLKQFADKVAFPVISTSRQAEEIVNRGYNYGSEHFLNKPINEKKMGLVVGDFFSQMESRKVLDLIQSRYFTKDPDTIEQIQKIIALGDLPLHINGPTGVGKQVLAELAHEINNTTSSTFLEKNCSTIQDNLAESVLFGHKKGAFTGADQDQKGLFERIQGGTLFLDEVNRLSKPVQAKLLKVLEQKIIEPLDSESSVAVNFNLITASSEDVEELVLEGKFLPDLWQRLRGETIIVRPLCERPVDVEYQLRQFMKRHESGRLFTISAAAKTALLNYDWPGNTRELKTLVDRLQRRRVKVLQVDHLGSLKNKTIRGKYRFANPQILKNVQKDGLTETIDELTKEIVEYYFLQNFGNCRKTMRQLDISSRRFYKHLNQIKNGEKDHDGRNI